MCADNASQPSQLGAFIREGVYMSAMPILYFVLYSYSQTPALNRRRTQWRHGVGLLGGRHIAFIAVYVFCVTV